MHPRLGSATLSQLAFSGEGNPNIPWQKSHWEITVVKVLNKNFFKKVSINVMISIALSGQLAFRLFGVAKNLMLPFSRTLLFKE